MSLMKITKKSQGGIVMQEEKNPLSRAYLLRCWQEGEVKPGQTPRWRFRVEEVLPGQRQMGFGSLEALITFLRAELAGGEEEE
jgi:hypothetical protein